MTVRELIEVLQTMPQDLRVVDMGEDVSGCKVREEYPDGDPCNPYCKWITVVEII